jgi:hypothetical protein
LYQETFGRPKPACGPHLPAPTITAVQCASAENGRSRHLRAPDLIRPARLTVTLRRTTRPTPGAAAVAVATTIGLLVSACGGSGSGSSGPALPTIAPAKVFKLVHFSPSTAVTAGKPVTVSFTVDQPSGAALTTYRKGPGPHTGVHLIIVRDDLSLIIHDHPPVGADGKVSQVLSFPKPGSYDVLVDIYPDVAGGPRNLQLFQKVRVAGAYTAVPTPPFASEQTVDGYRFTVLGKPMLKAVEPGFLTVRITDPVGKPAKLEQYYGALAHAIFFREKTLTYFHTHVCSPGSTACAGFSGLPTGTPTKPGVLRVGVLMPIGGVWRLFLQVRVGDRILTAPYTLHVAA